MGSVLEWFGLAPVSCWFRSGLGLACALYATGMFLQAWVIDRRILDEAGDIAMWESLGARIEWLDEGRTRMRVHPESELSAAMNEALKRQIRDHKDCRNQAVLLAVLALVAGVF